MSAARRIVHGRAANDNDYDVVAVREDRRPIYRGSREHLRDILRWEKDPCAQYAVHCHPDGLTVEQVAELLGVSVRAVYADQASALEKLRREGAELEGFLEAANDNEYGVELATVELVGDDP